MNDDRLERALVDAGAIPDPPPVLPEFPTPTSDPADWDDMSVFSDQPIWRNKTDPYAFTTDPAFATFWRLGDRDHRRPTLPADAGDEPSGAT